MVTSEKVLKSVIEQSLNPYLQDSDSHSYEEVQAAFQQLYHELKKAALTLPDALTTLEHLLAGKNYGVEDIFSSFYEIELALVSLMSEFDSEGRVLFRIVANTDNKDYIRNRAIELLGERSEKTIILELTPLVLDFHYNPNSYHFHPNESILETFFEVLGELSLNEALPWIVTLHNRFKVKALKSSPLELGDVTEDGVRSEQGDMDFHEQPFVRVRARLGDIAVLESNIRLSYSDWRVAHDQASEALQQLEQYVGRDTILAQLLKQPSTSLPSELDRYWYLIANGESIYIKRWALDQYLIKVGVLNLSVLTQLLPLLCDKTGYLSERVLDAVLKAPLDIVIPAANQALTQSDYDLSIKYSLLYILLQLNQSINHWLTIIPDILIPLPSFISNSLRQSILSYWVPMAEPRSDVRWLIEYELFKDTYLLTEYDNEVTQVESTDQLLPSGVRVIRNQVVDATINTSKPSYQGEVVVAQLVENLKAKGIAVDCYLDYADEMRQGASTFYTIKMQPYINETRIDENEGYANYDKEFAYKLADNLNISKLGAYMYYSTDESKNFTEFADMPNGFLLRTQTNHANEWSLASNSENLKVYQEEGEKLGLISLDNEVLNYIFPNLNIYFFGSRKPLPIRDLLFYWQD